MNWVMRTQPGGPLPEIQLNLVYLDLRRKERRVLLAVDGGHAATYQKYCTNFKCQDYTLQVVFKI